ncbi:MAG: hypothetical protein AB7F31_02840 [Parachlamydiales bacterium]
MMRFDSSAVKGGAALGFGAAGLTYLVLGRFSGLSRAQRVAAALFAGVVVGAACCLRPQPKPGPPHHWDEEDPLWPILETPPKHLDEQQLRTPLTLRASPSLVHPILVLAQKGKAIQESLKGTHYTFFHASSTPYLPIIYLIKALAVFLVERPLPEHLFYLRLPKENLPSRAQQLRTFKSTGTDDHKCRDDLLAVSASLMDVTPGESAMTFISENRNVCRQSQRSYEELIELVFKEVRELFEIRNRSLDTLKRTIGRLCNEAANYRIPGNLFVISIPKDEMEGVGYRAHPYGPVCNCFHTVSDKKILKMLQQDAILDTSVICASGKDIRGEWLPKTPQYRLLANHLTGKGFEIRLLSPLDPEVCLYFKEQVNQAVRDAIQPPMQ